MLHPGYGRCLLHRAFVFSAREDHIVPWTGGYKSAKTLGGKVRLVSANPAYEDILLDAEEVIVQGIAVELVRRLQK